MAEVIDMTRATCAGCKFMSKNDVGQHICQRFPPQTHVFHLGEMEPSPEQTAAGIQSVPNFRMHMMYPLTYPTMWCGEYKSKALSRAMDAKG